MKCHCSMLIILGNIFEVPSMVMNLSQNAWRQSSCAADRSRQCQYEESFPFLNPAQKYFLNNLFFCKLLLFIKYIYIYMCVCVCVCVCVRVWCNLLSFGLDVALGRINGASNETRTREGLLVKLVNYSRFNCQKHFYFELFSLVIQLFQTIHFSINLQFSSI